MIEFNDLTVLAAQLGTIAFLVETVTEVIKALAKDKFYLPNESKFYIALILGIAFAFIFNVSLFVTDYVSLHYLGCVLAGAIASRGANYAHDILNMIGSLRKTSR